MELIDKATILASVWISAQNDRNWDEFFQDNNLGIPYAFGIVYGHILSLSTDGEIQVKETWNSLCDKMDIDPDGAYVDFDHMFLTSQGE